MHGESAIVKQIEDSIGLKNNLKTQAKTILAISDCLVQALRDGRKVLLFGNGGSAADAQHIAAELSGKFYRDREPLLAVALTTNTSSLTAIANDFGYEAVFGRQLDGLVKEGNVVIGITTSGSSPNMLLAMKEAKRPTKSRNLALLSITSHRACCIWDAQSLG